MPELAVILCKLDEFALGDERNLGHARPLTTAGISSVERAP